MTANYIVYKVNLISHNYISGEEYVVLDDSQDHWWEVRNTRGEVGFIPSNYVKELDALGLQNFDW